MRLLSSLGIALCLFTFPTALVGQDVVNMSRHKFTFAAGDPAMFNDVDQAPLLEFCSDDDGCEVVLKMVRDTGLDVSNVGHLFLDPVLSKWTTASPVAGPFGDSDGSITPIIRVENSPTFFCEFNDDEEAVGPDSAVGFALMAHNATCVLMVID